LERKGGSCYAITLDRDLLNGEQQGIATRHPLKSRFKSWM
jgi:hypothetical protein